MWHVPGLISLTGHASNVPAPDASTPSHGNLLTNHERIITAMEGTWNLVQMERMALAKSNAQKRAVGRELEGINALNLLPLGWMDR